MNSKETVTLYVASDSLGETAEFVAKAVAVQFNSHIKGIKKFSFITDIEQIDEMMEEAKEENCVIAFTIVTKELSDHLITIAEKYNIKTVDIMKPIMDVIEEVTNTEPKQEVGLLRKLDKEYFQKVEAIEFAVKYDDGKDPRGVKQADLVLLGVSRTSKTPLSMYLAHRNLKVANIPIVPEVEPPKEIFQISNKKIIGLTTDPEKLNQIRQERLKALGLDENAGYANMNRILDELDYAEGIMKRVGCPVIDVSFRAVEETASIILEIIKGGN